MTGCADVLAFSLSNQNDEKKLKLFSAFFCKVRHCPVCAWRRSVRNVARFFAKMPDLLSLYPTHRWLFLTLTVRNCELEDLRTTISEMNAGWQRLIQRKNWPAVGWIRTVEVTRGKDGTAHPHFHSMLLVPPSYFGKSYVPHQKWVERWKSAAKLDYDPIVDIRIIKPKVAGQDLQAAVVETLKYGTKVDDLVSDPAFLFALTQQLHKTRFLASGGVLAGILKDDMKNEEMIRGDDQDEDDTQDDADVLTFKWQRVERKYRKQQ